MCSVGSFNTKKTIYFFNNNSFIIKTKQNNLFFNKKQNFIDNTVKTFNSKNLEKKIINFFI